MMLTAGVRRTQRPLQRDAIFFAAFRLSTRHLGQCTREFHGVQATTKLYLPCRSSDHSQYAAVSLGANFHFGQRAVPTIATCSILLRNAALGISPLGIRHWASRELPSQSLPEDSSTGHRTAMSSSQHVKSGTLGPAMSPCSPLSSSIDQLPLHPRQEQLASTTLRCQLHIHHIPRHLLLNLRGQHQSSSSSLTALHQSSSDAQGAPPSQGSPSLQALQAAASPASAAAESASSVGPTLAPSPPSFLERFTRSLGKLYSEGERSRTTSQGEGEEEEQTLVSRMRMQDPVVSASSMEITGEARAMFETVYEEIVALVGGEENLAPPKEIVWLNGAPGAGKGANTPFILQTRGFQATAIQVSDLLADNMDVAAVMASGGLVTDSMVLHLVLETILTLGSARVGAADGDRGEAAGHGSSADEAVSGAVVDGFPRTTLQVDFIKLLHDQLMDLHDKYLNTPLEPKFPRPIFRIAVLYVEEEESVRRQIGRGRAAIAHNQRVQDSGIGELMEVRPTDLCEKSARRRYKIFKEHYETLLRLKTFFPFHLIDGMGTLAECREQIEKELQYQSALELDATTFHAISHIPLASDVARMARQSLVARLDGYMAHETQLFTQVIDIIRTDVIPIVRRSALSGIALFNTEHPIFFSAPMAAEMLADILSERGYSVTWQARTREIPLRLDPETYNIVCMRKTSMQFRIKFERMQIRSATAQSAARALLTHSRGAGGTGLVPPREEREEERGKRKGKDSAVCQNIKPDGFPACFVPGEGGEGGGPGCAGGQGKETPGVPIPGLPLQGRIVREDHCPPLPEWAHVQRKSEN